MIGLFCPFENRLPCFLRIGLLYLPRAFFALTRWGAMTPVIIFISIMLARMRHVAILLGEALPQLLILFGQFQHLLLVFESTKSFALIKWGGWTWIHYIIETEELQKSVWFKSTFPTNDTKLMKPEMVVCRWPHQSFWQGNVPCKDERERHQSGVSQRFFNDKVGRILNISHKIRM